MPAPPAVTLTPPPGLAGKHRVGILLPLSGPRSALGQGLLDAATLAIFQVADSEFVLVPFDTAGTAEGGASAATAAVEENVELVIGPVFSAAVAEAAPVLLRAGINMIALSNNSAVAEPGVYLSGLLPEAQVDRVVRYAAQRGMRRVAALLPVGPFGARVDETLRATLSELQLDDLPHDLGSDWTKGNNRHSSPCSCRL